MEDGVSVDDNDCLNYFVHLMFLDVTTLILMKRNNSVDTITKIVLITNVFTLFVFPLFYFWLVLNAKITAFCVLFNYNPERI